MIPVWLFVLFLTIMPLTTHTMQHKTLQEKMIAGSLPLVGIDNNAHALNSQPQKTLKKNLCKKDHAHTINPDTIGVQQHASFVLISNIKVLPALKYRPRNTERVCDGNKKTMSIVTQNILESNECTYLAWYDGTLSCKEFKEYTRYHPTNALRYRMIQANSDGTLVAAGYDHARRLTDWISQIDIIDARNTKCTKRLITISIPCDENVLNMRFTKDNTHLLTRTEHHLYAWNLNGILKCHNTLDHAAQTVTQQHHSAPDIVTASASPEQSSYAIQAYYPHTHNNALPKDENMSDTTKVQPHSLRNYRSLASLGCALTAGLVLTFLTRTIF